MPRRLYSSLEPLESRIAPAALTVLHPLADVIAGVGDKSAKIDLGSLFDSSAAANGRTHIEFLTNFDTDPGPGFTAGKVVIELFDDKASFTVQNFLNYVNNLNDRGDYDGTFFHRSVNTPATAQNPQNLQILQAGGFEAAMPSVHIPVGVQVHNEYVSDDPELQNTLGTISLAKTAAGPNTGSSEFFFNMGDNSQTLGGTNNGGYTVFGKVTEGLAILQSIFAQPTANISAATKNGALTDVPYQGTYNPNPDQNLVTPPPAPKAGQLIQITSAQVLAPYNAVSEGVTFTISNYVDPATNTIPSFLSPSLVGDALTLKYQSGKAGVADVTILAEKPGFDPVTEVFRVSVLPNLALYSAGDSLQPYIGPGDTGTAKVSFVNNGAATLTGTYDLNFYLSKITSSDPTGQIFDNSDLANLVGTVTKTLNIASGESLKVTASLNLPHVLDDGSSPNYRLLAFATPKTGTVGNEVFADDNVMVDGKVHEMHNLFGTAATGSQLVRQNPSITYLDAENHLVTATLKGPGVGQVTQLDAAGHVDIDFYGTTDLSNISITAVDASGVTPVKTTVRRIAIRDDFNGTGVAGNVKIGNVNLSDSFFSVGGLRSLSVGDLVGANPSVTTNDHLILIGNSASVAGLRPVIAVGNLENTTIESTAILGSLTINNWSNPTVANASLLAGVKSFTVLGSMDADLQVSGVYGDARFMTATAAATTGVTSFKVAGVVSSSSIKIAGNVGTADVGGLQTSQFLVGTDSVPTNLASFNSLRTVGSFVVRGIPGQPYAITDSDVASAYFTSIKVANKAAAPIESASGNDAFGFVADSIAAYNRGGANPVVVSNITTGLTDQMGHYVVRLV